MHSLLAAGMLLGSVVVTISATPTAPFAADIPYSTPSVFFAADSEAGNQTLQARDLRSPIPNRALNVEHMFQPLLDFDKDGVSTYLTYLEHTALAPGMRSQGHARPSSEFQSLTPLAEALPVRSITQLTRDAVVLLHCLHRRLGQPKPRLGPRQRRTSQLLAGHVPRPESPAEQQRLQPGSL